MGQCAERILEVRGRKLHDSDFHNVHSWTHPIGITRSRSIICTAEDVPGKKHSTIQRSRPFGKPRRRWEDNFKIYLKQGVWQGVYLINLNRNRGSGGMVWTQEQGQWQHGVDAGSNVRVL